ncbi:MAG: hypothetical protein HOK97_02215, partial [Deltaproteobacteria bacterium]|nr:hypothetical protein [Deltaproteobacteria bacterium]
MHFEPIAIVGRSCLLPGALNPEQLWQAIVEKRNLVSRVPAGRWGLSSKNALKDPAEGGNGADAAWSDKGGYVDGFDKVFNPEGYGVPAQDITKLDPIFQWVLHTGREALRDAGVNENAKTGAIFGNLSFPTSGLSRFAERVWMGEERATLAGIPESNPANRFMSGLPAHMLA